MIVAATKVGDGCIESTLLALGDYIEGSSRLGLFEKGGVVIKASSTTGCGQNRAEG